MPESNIPTIAVGAIRVGREWSVGISLEVIPKLMALTLFNGNDMKDLYIVTKNKKIIYETECLDLLNDFTEKLCDEYEKELTGAHSVYVKSHGRFFLSHLSWFSGSGEVNSRAYSPRPDQTEKFLREYNE